MMSDDTLSIASTPANELEAVVQRLMLRPEIKETVATMIGFRQAYAVTCDELVHQINEAGPPEVYRLPAVNAMSLAVATASGEPFEIMTLVKGFAETITPWFNKAVTRRVNAERLARHTENQEQETLRRAQPVPLPEPFLAVARDKPLVFCGEGPLVVRVLDYIQSYMAGYPDRSICHLRLGVLRADTVPVPSDLDQILVPRGDWMGCANTPNGLGDRLKDYSDHFSRMPDAMLIDNVVDTLTNGFLGRDRAWVAADAIKTLQKWSDRTGAALICGVFGEAPSADWITGKWERLRAHTTLYLVTNGVSEDAGPLLHLQMVTSVIGPILTLQLDGLPQLGAPNPLILR